MGLVCFVPSLRFKTVPVVVSVSSINLFGILTAVVFFGEAFLPKHFVSLTLAAVGVLLVALKKNQASHNRGFDMRSVALPLLAAFFWGVGYTLFKIPLQWMTPLELGIAIEVIVWLVSAVLLLLDAKVPFAKFKTAYTGSPHFYVSGMLLTVGSLFTNIGLSKLPIAVLNILGMFTFPVSIMSAKFLYKENKTTATEWAGISLILASILLLTLLNYFNHA